MVVVLMVESSRSLGRVMGFGMMGFVMPMNDDRIIGMMIGGPRMDVLGGQRCQHREAQSRDGCRQSARFEQEHRGLLLTREGISQHRQFCDSKTRTSAGWLPREGTAT